MERVILGIILLAGVAAGQQLSIPRAAPAGALICGVTDADGALKEWVECPLPGGTKSRSTPSNEVAMQPLEYGKTYSGKAVDVLILPRDEEAGGILLAITAKVQADFAIIEVLHREVARIEGRDLKLFRSKTQAIRVSEGAPYLSDPIPLKLEDIEKINVRLVTESNVVEFWSDTAETKKPVK